MTTNELFKLWVNVYEGEGEGGAGASEGEGGAGADDNKNNQGGASKQFSQDDVNRFLASEKRKWGEKQQKAIEELEALKAKANLTDEERTQYDTRIETMKNELLTKEQIAQKDREKIEKTYKKQLEETSKEKESWKGRYVNETVTRSIVDAAVLGEAFRPEQIVAIVRPNTRLIEELDSDGKPTGNLIPKVTLQDTDKEGKPVTLELSPKEAVKRMKEMEEYFNLFKGEGTGGIGGINRGGIKNQSVKDLAKDPQKYREARKAGKVKFQ